MRSSGIHKTLSRGDGGRAKEGGKGRGKGIGKEGEGDRERHREKNIDKVADRVSQVEAETEYLL